MIAIRTASSSSRSGADTRTCPFGGLDTNVEMLDVFADYLYGEITYFNMIIFSFSIHPDFLLY